MADPNSLVRISSGGVEVFHVKGWGPKSSACPSKSREAKRFGRDIPRLLPGYPGGARKFEKKIVFNSRPLSFRKKHMSLRKITRTLAGCPCDTRRDKQGSTGWCPKKNLVVYFRKIDRQGHLSIYPGHRPVVPTRPSRGASEILCDLSYVPFCSLSLRSPCDLLVRLPCE